MADPSGITLREVDPADIPTPADGKDTIFMDVTASPPAPAFKNSAGIVESLVGPAGPVGPPGPAGAISVNPNGALLGDGSGGNPLSVSVDNVTIGINASNELESIASVSVDPNGAIGGTGSALDPIRVNVDHVTIGINASDELESLIANPVTHTGALTAGKTIIGNGAADITVSALTAALVASSGGTLSAVSVGTGLHILAGVLSAFTDNETIGTDSNGKLEVIANYVLKAALRMGLAVNSGWVDVNVDNETIGIDSRNKLEVIKNYVSPQATLTLGKMLLGQGAFVAAAVSFELDYVEFTSPVNPAATSEATASTVVTGSAVTYDGGTVVTIEFFAVNARPDTSAIGDKITFCLYQDGVSIGQLGVIQTTAAQSMNVPVHLVRRMTPSTGSHTYSIRAFVTTSTGLVTAGTGGSGNAMPGFIRITRALP
jgi:hypothetical protein